MAAKRTSDKPKSQRVFGQTRRPAKMFRAGLYARVPTNDQQTIPLQIRSLREYAARRGWTIAIQVKEVGSGASERQLREKLLEAARRRQIDVVLVWRLDRWGRSVADLLATLQELDHLGVGFVSLTEALGRFCGNECALAWPTPGRTESDWAGRQLRHFKLLKSGNSITRASANPRSPASCGSVAPPFAGFWRDYLSEKWSASHAVRLANLFIEELATNMRAKIPTLGFSRKELLILMWRELGSSGRSCRCETSNTAAACPHRTRLK